MARINYRGHTYTGPNGERMWVPPDAVFTVTRPGFADVDLTLTGTVQLYSIGTRYEDIFGRVFRYVEYGGTIAQNSMVDAEIPDAVHDDLDLDTGGAAVGALTLSIDSPETGTEDFIANEYAQGWAFAEKVVSDVILPIASHPLWDISDTPSLTVTLFLPVRVAIAADSDISFVKSKFKEVIIAAAATASVTVGVNTGTGAVDGRFGWVQTRGPAKVLTAGTLVIGDSAVVITTAGAVGPTGADDVSARIGRVINVGPDTEWSMIDVALE